MSVFTTLTKKILAAAAVAACVAAPASATVFSISSVGFDLGIGYGVDTNETNGTLLDVRFTAATFAPLNFDLGAVNSFSQFKIGSVNFAEPQLTSGGNGVRGIKTEETNDLGVAANFTFIAPGVGAKQVSAAGTATAGLISDADTDYSLSFTTKEVTFGNTGKFSIAVDPLSFSTQGTKELWATLTLLALDTVPLIIENPPINNNTNNTNNTNKVPEPGSLALMGLGVAALAARRRRAA